MSAPNIPAVLRRLAELHAIYSARGSSWWSKWNAKRKAFLYLTRYGRQILDHIEAQDQALRKSEVAAQDARREGFYSGRFAQEKYDRLMAQWKVKRKGKMPQHPKPI
jgi:hypothetical protein